MIKIVWKCINIIAISPKRGMEQAEIMDTFWTYQAFRIQRFLSHSTSSSSHSNSVIIFLTIHFIKHFFLSLKYLFYLSGNHRSMFANKFEFTSNISHIITQVFNHIRIVFQLSTKISIKVFLLDNKIIKLIKALSSRLIVRNITFIKSIERIYLYYLCRVIKTRRFFNR